VCPLCDHNLSNRVDSHGVLVVVASIDIPRLMIASGRPPCSPDRLDDAVYLVRAAGLNCDVVSDGGIEAVFSGSNAGGGAVVQKRQVRRILAQRAVSALKVAGRQQRVEAIRPPRASSASSALMGALSVAATARHRPERGAG
jgi:hypothetical protein